MERGRSRNRSGCYGGELKSRPTLPLCAFDPPSNITQEESRFPTLSVQQQRQQNLDSVMGLPQLMPQLNKRLPGGRAMRRLYTTN